MCSLFSRLRNEIFADVKAASRRLTQDRLGKPKFIRRHGYGVLIFTNLSSLLSINL